MNNKTHYIPRYCRENYCHDDYLKYILCLGPLCKPEAKNIDDGQGDMVYLVVPSLFIGRRSAEGGGQIEVPVIPAVTLPPVGVSICTSHTAAGRGDFQHHAGRRSPTGTHGCAHVHMKRRPD